MRFVSLVAFVACTPNEADPADTHTSGTPGTTVFTPPVESSSVGAVVTCEVTDNTIRVACTATLDVAAPGTWTAERAGSTVLTLVSASSTDHAVTLYGLAPDTAYVWSFDAGAARATGNITTGVLPSDLDALSIEASGTASAVEHVLISQQCTGVSYLLVVNTLGEVVWYESAGTGGGGGGVTGYTWTEDNTFLWSYGQTDIIEMEPGGLRLWEASGFDRPLHHDLNKGSGRVYALNAEEHDGVVVDGLYVLEGGAVVAEWDLYDHVTIVGTGQSDPFWQSWFPGAEDWSHANSVWSDGTTAVVSLRWQDAVLEISADPLAPDFGTILSTLTGTEDSDLTSEYTWVGGGDFDGQHHVTPTADGYLLFDNRGLGEFSRALNVTVDRTADTVAEGESWSVLMHCDIQGAAYPLEGGNVLVTCATESRVQEFESGNSIALWDLTASCGPAGGPGGGAFTARGVPVTF